MKIFLESGYIDNVATAMINGYTISLEEIVIIKNFLRSDKGRFEVEESSEHSGWPHAHVSGIGRATIVTGGIRLLPYAWYEFDSHCKNSGSFGEMFIPFSHSFRVSNEPNVCVMDNDHFTNFLK